MNGTQKKILSIGLALAVVLVGAYFVFAKQNEQVSAPKDNSPYVSLVAYNLTKKQQAELEDFLKANNYEFQSDNKGISVHQGQKDSILIEMAKRGIPSNEVAH